MLASSERRTVDVKLNSVRHDVRVNLRSNERGNLGRCVRMLLKELGVLEEASKGARELEQGRELRDHGDQNRSPSGTRVKQCSRGVIGA